MIKHQLEAVGFCPPFCQSLIGTKYGKSVAQVITRWLVERDIIVVAKSTKPERMAENLNVFDFALSDEDKAEIAKLDGTFAAIVSARPKDLAQVVCCMAKNTCFRLRGMLRLKHSPVKAIFLKEKEWMTCTCTFINSTNSSV